jgi:hypothetical protein
MLSNRLEVGIHPSKMDGWMDGCMYGRERIIFNVHVSYIGFYLVSKNLKKKKKL